MRRNGEVSCFADFSLEKKTSKIKRQIWDFNKTYNTYESPEYHLSFLSLTYRSWSSLSSFHLPERSWSLNLRRLSGEANTFTASTDKIIWKYLVKGLGEKLLKLLWEWGVARSLTRLSTLKLQVSWERKQNEIRGPSPHETHLILPYMLLTLTSL